MTLRSVRRGCDMELLDVGIMIAAALLGAWFARRKYKPIRDWEIRVVL